METVTTTTSEPSCVRSIGSLIIFIGISIDYHNKISRPVAATVVAITTAVIAARKHSRRLLAKNSG